MGCWCSLVSLLSCLPLDTRIGGLGPENETAAERTHPEERASSATALYSGGHRPQAPGVWPAFRSPLEWSFSPTESASPECSAVPKHLVQLSPFMHEGVEPELSAGPEGHPRDGSLTASSLATTPPASSLASKPLVLSPNVR